MFVLGYVWVGEYRVWITTPVFSEDPYSSKAENLSYYEVMLSKRMNAHPDNYYCHVDLLKEFLKIDLTDRNPLSKPKDTENPTEEELEFRVESQYYLARKSQVMPLVKLSRRHIEKLLQIIQEGENKC